MLALEAASQHVRPHARARAAVVDSSDSESDVESTSRTRAIGGLGRSLMTLTPHLARLQ